MPHARQKGSVMIARTTYGLVGIAAILCSVWCVPALGTMTSPILNGDFESGNTGFTSGYTYATVDQGTYFVSANPHSTYPSSLSFGDHTTGSGNMLTADG